MTGKLLIVSGPSGVGKDSLLNAWAKSNPRVARVLTTTTRRPRNDERDGVDYRFVTPERFRELAAEGAFLEWKEVHGNLYGSPAQETALLVSQGKIAVLEIDVQGAAAVMNQRPDAETVFILPPSIDELERRLRGRALDSEAAIRQRLANAKGELAEAPKYRHQIVNDTLEHAVARLEEIVR